MYEDDSMIDEWLEIEGRSKEDALERACNALNTTLPYLEYQVVGGKGSKIRARKRETPRETVEEKKLEAQEARPERQPRGPRPERPRRERGEEPPRRADHEDRVKQARTHEAQPDDEEVSKGNVKEAEEEPEVLLDEPSEVGIGAKEALCGVLKHIDDTANVEIRETTQEVQLEIIGNGSGLFIGKRGATLEALQHLVAKMMGLDRRSGKRITVDSEQYRKRRQEALEGLARKLAGRARRERRPISVEPMSAIDRRILHLALKNDPSVMTKSVGEGSNRKVVVVPRNQKGEGEGREDRGGSRGTRGPSREGRARSGGNSRRPSGGRSAGAKAGRERMIPPGRMHDSFDVPSVPDDVFENDEDLMAMDDAVDAKTSEASTSEMPLPVETQEEER